MTSGGNLLLFKIPVRRVMGSKSNCLLVSYSICSLAKRFLLFAYLPASDYHSVILNDLNCLCESGAVMATIHHKMSTLHARLPRKPINNTADKCLPENYLTNEDIENSMTHMNQGGPCSLSNKCRSGKH